VFDHSSSRSAKTPGRDILFQRVDRGDSGNPIRLTVPSGVSRVRLLGNVRWQSDATGERQALITRNGAAFQGQPMARHGAAGLTGQNLAGPALAVSAGDVFDLSVWHSAGASLNVEADSQS
jgi:hypothetical protein